MNIEDLEKRYYIESSDIQKLESLHLLDGVRTVGNMKTYQDQDVRDIMEMLHLLNLGLDDQELVAYYTHSKNRLPILKKVRTTIFEHLHTYQKHLDYIDYLIYNIQKHNNGE